MKIAFFNNKGGIGKTTLSVHTAFRAMKKGIPLQFIDADMQCNGIKWITQDNWDGSDYLDFNNIVLTTNVANINSYEGITLVDCPPEYGLIRKLYEQDILFDVLILPVQGRFSLDGAMNVLEEIRTLEIDTRVVFVINMVDSNNSDISKKQIAEVQKAGVELFKYSIMRNKYVEIAEFDCKSVFDIPYSMRSSAVQIISTLGDWVLAGCPSKFTYGETKLIRRLEKYEV